MPPLHPTADADFADWAWDHVQWGRSCYVRMDVLHGLTQALPTKEITK